ncbi:MAG: GAF domain-containing protein [Ardenticatenaceae bacterium]|nr:GAF domain-containing protein [Ardenticatenaceae bacterium]MCB9443852.1 GAF domain-containing protein [Ardenticatenaceae bacterium]
MSDECILVIDDSKEIVKHLAQTVLPSFGYKTLFAHDGLSGLKLIRDGKADLIVLDYNLPGMTGIDILQQMAQEGISTPVVLMTGYGSELSAIEAFRLGAKDYLIKPFTVDEVLETIDRALMETRLLHDKEELAEQLRRVKVEMSRQTHEMNELSRIGKAITSLLSVDKVLERVLEAATYLTNAEDSTIWLPDKSGKWLKSYEKPDRAEKSPDILLADSLAGNVIKGGRPLRESSFSGAGIEVRTGYFSRSILYVPLKLRGVTIGVLGVGNIAVFRAFSRRDEFLLSFLADYAAIALENARVYQAADQALATRLEELNTLIDITQTITSSLDLNEVIRMTIKQVHDSWDIEASSVWLLDETEQSLRVLTNVGTPMEILSQVKVPIGRGFVGHVAQKGKWIYTNDAHAHPVFYSEVDELTGFKTRSLLCVPLLFGGKIIGVMQLLNKIDDTFDDQDVERALTIASAIAIAVTNALLFKDAATRKQHLEATLEHTNHPILIMDRAGHVSLLNKNARTRLGLTKDAIGKPLGQVLPFPELLALIEAEADASRINQLEIELPDESVWVPEIASIPDLGSILILQDISRLKALNKAKDNFVTTVSHDMRAPLNTIAGFINGLEDVGPLNEQQLLFVERSRNALQHMTSLVDGLLELARYNSELEQQHVACDLTAIAEDVINEFQGQAMSKNIALSLEMANGTVWVMGDAGQLRRALSNLVDNALKYSPAKGAVKVGVTAVTNHILISVQDEGPGIPETDISFIFDKFYRGKGNDHIVGTGLGLALVKSIAQAHGGQTWAENQEGGGAVFYLQLPAAE